VPGRSALGRLAIGVDVGSLTLALLLEVPPLAGAAAGPLVLPGPHALSSCRPTTLPSRAAVENRNFLRLIGAGRIACSIARYQSVPA
jgi:hypothetical protein